MARKAYYEWRKTVQTPRYRAQEFWKEKWGSCMLSNDLDHLIYIYRNMQGQFRIKDEMTKEITWESKT